MDGPDGAENLDPFGASYEGRTSWKYISFGGPTSYGATKERNPCLGLNVPWRPELWVSPSLSDRITPGSIQPRDLLQARAYTYPTPRSPPFKTSYLLDTIRTIFPTDLSTTVPFSEIHIPISSMPPAFRSATE